jgi:hypothetical protein
MSAMRVREDGAEGVDAQLWWRFVAGMRQTGFNAAVSCVGVRVNEWLIDLRETCRES